MASKTVLHPVNMLHERRIDEINAETLKVFCVASGGSTFANKKEAITEAMMFEVIKDLSMRTDLSWTLKDLINDLASRAGSTFKSEAANV